MKCTSVIYFSYMIISKLFVLSLIQFYYSQGFQLEKFPTDTIVKEGSAFTLECTFSSSPILINWLFNDVDTVPTSNSSTLVRTASTETAGYYRCEASFQLGIVVSEPALIQIGYIYTTVNTPVDVVGYESSWLLLSCDHVISLPQATVLWLEEDLIERPVTGSDSLETLLNGSLLFSNLSSANEAMYICHASNPSTQEFRRVVYNLTVSTGLLEVSGVPSQLLFLTPTDIVVSAGENAIFQCFVGSSYSMLRWYHEGSLISADSSSYSVLDNGVTLVVERAETKQSGEYRCEVEGIGSLSGNLTVIDTPIIYLTGSADVESDLETSFSLTCSLEEGVTAEWSWLKNGELVYEPIWTEGELRVSFTQESDEGLYQCVACNDVGRDMKTFRVNVISYPPMFLNSEHLPSKIHFTHSPLLLNCSAVSVPAPQFSWSRDFLSLTDAINQGHFSSPLPGILEDDSLSKQDSGNYTCTVNNSVGTARRSMYITVLDGPKFIYEPTFGSFALLRDNYLVCEASVDETLSLSFRWLINGTQELETDERVKYLSPRQGTLIFKNTQPSDTGEYQCLVEAIDNNSVVVPGSSLSSSPVHIKVLDVSAAPTDLLVTNVSTDSLTLTWIPDSSQPSSLFHIFLSIQYMNGTLETVNSFQVDSSPAKLTDLLPHSLYFVQVSAGSQLVVGPKTLPPLQVLTQQAGPTASPHGLRSYLVNENSLMLEWNHPPERQLDGSGRNGDILSYDITLISQLASSKTFLTSTNHTSHHLTNLSPYTLYSISVTAVGREGRSPPSAPLLIRTLASEPVRGPKHISCKPVSVTSIACRVVLPEVASRNGYIDGYEVRYKEVNEEEWTSKLVRNNANLSAIGDVREILLPELLFNNAYYLNVSLFNNVTNSIRVGPSVLVGPIITRDPVPGSPSHLILTDLNSVSIKATWSLPSRFNSQIIGYCLVLTRLSTPYNVELLYVCKNDSLEHTFSGLDANTGYSVSLAAKNNNGLGLELENRITLNPGPPSPPNFKIFLTGSTVFLKWSPTATGGSPITGYRLEYSWDGSNWLEFHSFNYTELGFQTRSLPSGTFMVRIVAITSLGESVSEELIVIVPDRSLLNELSVQIVIAVTVLLLIILIIVIASCICILYIRRKKKILHRLHHTEKPESLPKTNTQIYPFDYTQDYYLDLVGGEHVYPQFLTEDQLMVGTNPDFENFELEDEQLSADAKGKVTPPLPLTPRVLHLSPSLSSLQKPFKIDLGSYPIWNNPRVRDSPEEPVPPPEFREYVSMNALTLRTETESDGGQQIYYF